MSWIKFKERLLFWTSSGLKFGITLLRNFMTGWSFSPTEPAGTQEVEKAFMDTMVEAGQSSNSRIGYMLPESLEAAWPHLLAIMQAHPEGLLDGFFNEGDVFAALATNRYDAWLAMDEDFEQVQAVALCRLEKYEAFSIYRICWVGGKLGPLLREGIGKIEAYAANVLKAEKVAFDCRKGLVRLAEPLGYKIFRYEVWKTVQRSN